MIGLGGDGFDLVYYWGLTSGVKVRVNGSSTPQNTGGGGIDTLIGFEGIIGTDYADSLRGNSVANFLLGEDGDDVLIGFAGDDTLEGGEGNDFLNGGTGADMMRGSLGNDIYYVDNVGDVVVERASDTAENEEGIDEVRTTLNDYVLGDNVENLRLQGAATSGTGNDLANIIIAGIGPATLTGLGGNDTIYGSASGDSIDGGTDNDALYGRNGNDNINGGDGDDLIRGQFGSDTLHGDAGNDLLFGDEGQDTIYGGDGDDDLRGGIQTDTLYGESGNDFLRGEDGNDILYGGAGRDVFTGGAGNDQFWFMDGDFAGLTSSTADRITDFVSGSDRIRLDLVDANIHVAGDQAFQFIGTTAFTGAGTSSSGELRYEVVGGSTIISGDTDGDGTADFAIALTGNYALIVGDFGL